MGGTQFVGATAHATGYLVVADTAHAVFEKYRLEVTPASMNFSQRNAFHLE
jgi:hypothetical protein